ncbi:hypothetical protein B0F87_1132 [Methylobacter tundripaludum]|uniref:Uncharacterized protein n=1 Tax=Methylobacter tundripaludum TaxID=173365 RepID=A0A2S6H8Y6_9GAMM|nr:hypothetical protein [Methylobacter tundripaludum]PPK73891.1 hypothetical protein B0F87_1132 [Methylobacter tundripaludum]
MDYIDLHNKLNVPMHQIRSLAIQCHALDEAPHSLMFKSQIPSQKTISAYEEIFASTLLSLAITIRTKFYQGIESKSTNKYIKNCGTLYKNHKLSDSDPIEFEFTIKDVCDKIIHASSITRPLEKEENQPTTLICGTRQEKLPEWELYIVISEFCIGVLNWIEEIESVSFTSQS